MERAAKSGRSGFLLEDASISFLLPNIRMICGSLVIITFFFLPSSPDCRLLMEWSCCILKLSCYHISGSPVPI